MNETFKPQEGEAAQNSWEELPDHFDNSQEITAFYENMSIEEIVARMKIISAEWNKGPDGTDERVKSKELPLIEAFERKATPEDIKKYEQELSAFEICDDGRAVDIARRLQGKEKEPSMVD